MVKTYIVLANHLVCKFGYLNEGDKFVAEPSDPDIIVMLKSKDIEVFGENERRKEEKPSQKKEE